MQDIMLYLADQISSFDHRVLVAINGSMRLPFMDAIMPWITRLGDGGVFWIALALVLLIPKKTRRTGAAMAVAMLLGLIIGNGLIKNLVMRTRPFDLAHPVVSRSNLLIAPPSDYSFPSGHTLASFEAATALFKDHSVYGFLAYVLAILIAFSRLPAMCSAARFSDFCWGFWAAALSRTWLTRRKRERKRSWRWPLRNPRRNPRRNPDVRASASFHHFKNS